MGVLGILRDKAMTDKTQLTPGVPPPHYDEPLFTPFGFVSLNQIKAALDLPSKQPVECGNCGWTGKRKPGNFVICPKCGSIAAFQIGRSER